MPAGAVDAAPRQSPQVATPVALTCPTCGLSVAPGTRFCGRCGQAIGQGGAPAVSARPPAAVVCSRCGLSQETTAQFCGRCGQPLASAAAVPRAVPQVVFPRAVPAQARQGVPHKTAGGISWSVLAALVGVAMVVLAIVSQLIMSHGAKNCGVSCPVPHPPHPPTPLGPSGPPLAAQSAFTSSQYGFRLEYPADFLSPTKSDAQSVSWSATVPSDGSGFALLVQGEAANGRSAQQIVDALQQSKASGATVVFGISGAELGSTDGYGNVYDLTVTPQSGQQAHYRLVIESAVRNGIAVDLLAVSNFTADQNEHPSPAQLEPQVESIADVIGNTVTWKDEPPI